jgi:RNA polymerase sigma factor (sigma-70 family)
MARVSRGEEQPTDEQLVAACLAGDQTAWSALVDRYAALIYSIALKYGFADADASDVFQAVCLTLLAKLATLRAPGGLAAWIMTTTSRECLALIRRRRREDAHRAGGVELDVAAEALPEEQLLALERQHIVRTAIDQLPDTCRRLVAALFSDAAQAHSYRELAAELGVPPNSLGPTRQRCLEKLRRLLAAAGYSP